MTEPAAGSGLNALQQAALAVQQLRRRVDQLEGERREPIAIVGTACRFPGGVATPDALWEFLRAGGDAVRGVPADRWDADRYFDPNPDRGGTIYTRHGSFLDGVDLFDAPFFGLSAREAESLDPQQRLLLEVAWEALERGGQAPDALRETRTGVFVGIGQNDYARRRLFSGADDLVGPYDGTGNGFCFAAGRLSYVLGLHGPNMAIDTACSASLVAVHVACQSLRLRECDTALAGGVQLMLSPEVTLFLSRARALSPDGRCRTFDAAANGYGRGEGC
ncbi:MAG TPA: polyketide synthase, partial [Vicinamibacterales bacterium]|nr:polyketide synthase [Vicinamibacterales bacterium]